MIRLICCKSVTMEDDPLFRRTRQHAEKRLIFSGAKSDKQRLEDIKEFFNTKVKGNNYTYLVIGNRELVDMEVLEKMGELKELTLEEFLDINYILVF